jgi:SAM-dependent methyltransferase
MKRVLEPELMEDPEQARAYASADFEDAERLFVDLVERHAGPGSARVADLGCGPGGLTVRVARSLPAWQIDALDGATAMIAMTRDAVAAAGLAGRVRAVHGRLPDVLAHPGGLTPGAYDRVITSSLLHHLPDPDVLWQSCKRLLRPGGVAVVLDLARPATDADARALVRAVAADAHPILQADFLHSLRAAFTPAEVTAQLDRAGLAGWSVSMASSRHLAVVGRRP